MVPILFRGYKNPLQEADLYRLQDQFITENLVAEFHRVWEAEKARFRRVHGAHHLQTRDTTTTHIWRHDFLHMVGIGSPRDAPSLGRAVFSIMEYRHWVAIAELMLFYISNVVFPFIIEAIINFITATQDASRPPPPVYQGFMLVLAVFICVFVGGFAYQDAWCHTRMKGFATRSFLSAAIYEKSFRLSGKARRQYSSGEIMNLASTDAANMDDLMMTLQLLFPATSTRDDHRAAPRQARQVCTHWDRLHRDIHAPANHGAESGELVSAEGCGVHRQASEAPE